MFRLATMAAALIMAALRLPYSASENDCASLPPALRGKYTRAEEGVTSAVYFNSMSLVSVDYDQPQGPPVRRKGKYTSVKCGGRTSVVSLNTTGEETLRYTFRGAASVSLHGVTSEGKDVRQRTYEISDHTSSYTAYEAAHNVIIYKAHYVLADEYAADVLQGEVAALREKSGYLSSLCRLPEETEEIRITFPRMLLVYGLKLDVGGSEGQDVEEFDARLLTNGTWPGDQHCFRYKREEERFKYGYAMMAACSKPMWSAAMSLKRMQPSAAARSMLCALSFLIINGTLESGNADLEESGAELPAAQAMPWSRCSDAQPCKPATRFRKCVFETGGAYPHVRFRPCEGGNEEVAYCDKYRAACERLGNFKEWGEWSACSPPCATTATRYRTRNCDADGEEERCGPDVPHLDSEDCLRSCRVGGYYSPWTDWSVCSDAPECGYRFRELQCDRRVSARIAACKSPTMVQGEFCGCAKESEVIGHYTSWSECTVTCGLPGARTRMCLSVRCTGPLQKLCDRMDPCPGNSVIPSLSFSEWSEWSQCSASCSGSQSVYELWSSRVRACLFVGCEGDTEQKRACPTARACPLALNKSFSGSSVYLMEWTPWSSCSVTCGTGMSLMSRTCMIGKEDGDACDGWITLRERVCDAGACPASYWHMWSQWSRCATECTTERTRRVRSCSARSACSGEPQESKACPCHGLDDTELYKLLEDLDRRLKTDLNVTQPTLWDTFVDPFWVLYERVKLFSETETAAFVIIAVIIASAFLALVAALVSNASSRKNKPAKSKRKVAAPKSSRTTAAKEASNVRNAKFLRMWIARSKEAISTKSSALSCGVAPPNLQPVTATTSAVGARKVEK